MNWFAQLTGSLTHAVRLGFWLGLIFILQPIAPLAQPEATGTSTPTATSTATFAPTSTLTPTYAPTATFAPTFALTPTYAPTATFTPTNALTPTYAPTVIFTPTYALTPTYAPTSEPTATPSPLFIPVVGFGQDAATVFESTVDGSFAFTVYLSGSSENSVAVDYTTTSTQSAQPDLDYLPASGVLTFPPHSLSKNLYVTIAGDSLAENNETFRVILRNPAGATLGRASLTLTILDESISSILRYLLGLTTNASGLDANSDGTIDVADLLTRVGLLPPQAPAGPSPVDAMPNVPVSVTLGWNRCARADRYSVYLWPATQSRPSTPIAENLEENSYAPVSPLTEEQTYRWQIVAVGAHGVTEGPVWSFTTQAGADLAILEPAGATTWQAGGEASVRWKLALDAGTDCRLELWRAGEKVADLATGFSASGEDVTRFTVPKVPAGDGYQVRAVSVWLERQAIPEPYVQSGPNLRIEAK